MDELKGKKLLILGAYNSEKEIVNVAKKMGVYTIVTDNNLDWDKAPAKKLADEAWNISWSDIELLKEKCIEEKVDGVLAGFDEFRIKLASKLSKEIGKPFYTDGSKLDDILDKEKFKKACKECKIRVPKEYIYGDKNIEFPVIVKPCDTGGSSGITICYSKDEFDEAYNKAKEISRSGKILIEEYIRSDEVIFHLTVHNGNIDLSAMCDKKTHLFDKKIPQITIRYAFSIKIFRYFDKI